MPLDVLRTEELWRVVTEAITEALSIRHHGPMLNERYLHHFLSGLMQAAHPLLDLKGASDRLLLHPEWPTSKKSTKITGGLYKGTKGAFQPNETEGTEGAIDFALGDYLSPVIGIELSLKESWSHNEAVYDYLKLLDGKNNSFKYVVSLNMLMRRAKKLSQEGRRENIYQAMKNDLSAAKLMLTDSPCPADRRCVFIVTEIAQQDRRHWYWDEARQDFIPTVDVPPVLKLAPRQG